MIKKALSALIALALVIGLLGVLVAPVSAGKTYSSLEILKVDGSEPLAGATFVISPNPAPDLYGGTNLTVVDNVLHDSDSRPGVLLVIFCEISTTQEYTVCETVAPAGYDKAPCQTGIKITSSTKVTLTFVNTPSDCKGEIEIYKKDDEGEPLGGACFNITPDPSGQTGTLEVCDDDANDAANTTDGTIKLENVPCGNYTITESKAPFGYVIATESQNVTVTNNVTANVTFNNTPCTGEIEIKKLDESGAVINMTGACFKISDDPYNATATEPLEVCDNDENDADNTTAGVILLVNIPPGSYNISEVQAPSGYVLDSTIKAVNVTCNTTPVSVNFTNTPCAGEIEIYKKDDEGEPLGGACFNISPDPTSVNLMGTLEVCDNDANDAANTTNGTIKLENVPCGNYTITEASAPLGYVIATGSQNVTVTNNVTANVTFNNTPCVGEIRIRKFDDAAEPQSLGGACFNISPNPYNATATEPLEVCDEDNDGIISLKDIPPGDYDIFEVQAPEGYVLSSSIETANVTCDITLVSINFTNTLCMGKIEIKKFDESEELLGGACFNITPNPYGIGTLTICDNDVNDAATTNGTILLIDVPPFSYNISEIQAPSGYVFDPSIIKTVNVTCNITPASVNFTNTPCKGEIEIKKSCGQGCTPGYWKNHLEDWPPTGYSPAQNVSSVFNVSSCKDIENLAGDTLLEALEYPGGDGTVGAARILLRAAVAALLNTAHPDVGYLHTEGYVINAVNSALASCDRDTMLSLAMQLDKDNNAGCPLGESETCGGAGLGGATFEISPNPYGSGTLTVTDNDDNDADNATGIIRLVDIPCGNYTVAETKAPPGYVLDPTPQSKTVGNGEKATFEFYNMPGPCLGGIEILKLDVSGDRIDLEGVSFNISPNPYDEGSTEPLTVVDNEVYDADDTTNGRILLVDIPCGNYTITEHSAPPGYVKVTGSQNVTVTDNQTETVGFSNTRISEAAIKVDKTAALYGEGCTPGYWKNHPEDWPTGYNESQNVSSVFNVTSCASELGGDTLLEALDYPGGKAKKGAARILLRAAVAAVLNAAHSDVDYPRTVEEVIDAVNRALARCNRNVMLSLATQLDRDNNEGCPLDGGSCDACCPGTDPLRVSIGDTVVYCYTVTNIGDVALYNVTLMDDMGTPDTGDDVPVPLDTTTLAPGESTNGTLEYVVVDDDASSKTNNATATGTPEVGTDVTDTDECTIVILSLSPTAQLR